MTLASRWFNHHVSQVFHGFWTKVKHHHKLSFPTLSDLLRRRSRWQKCWETRASWSPSLKSGGMLWIRNHHVEIQCSVQRGVNNYNILLSIVHKQNHHFVALCWPAIFVRGLETSTSVSLPWGAVHEELRNRQVEVDFTPVLNAFVAWTRKKNAKNLHLSTKDSTGGKCDSTCLEKRGGGWFETSRCEPRPAALCMTRCRRFELHWSRHRCGFTCLGIDNSISLKKKASIKNLQKILQGK